MIQRLSTGLVRAVLLVGLCLVGWSECAGQVARYEPSTPTISPYLNLTRFNNFGGLPNYYALVRPQIQQRRVNLQEQARLRQQERQIIQLESEVQQGLITPAATGTGSWFMTPGTQSTFMNTTQFYPQPIIRGGRR